MKAISGIKMTQLDGRCIFHHFCSKAKYPAKGVRGEKVFRIIYNYALLSIPIKISQPTCVDLWPQKLKLRPAGGRREAENFTVAKLMRLQIFAIIVKRYRRHSSCAAKQLTTRTKRTMRWQGTKIPQVNPPFTCK